MTRRTAVLLLALAAAFTPAACGSDNKVGDESLLNFKEETQERLGETTTTTAAATTTTTTGKGAATTTTKPKAAVGGPVSTTATTAGPVSAPTATTATTADQPAQTIREVHIYGDDAAQPLDPQIQTAYVGSIIRWVNHDTVARAVRADSGQFASPMISPGGSWDYTAGTVGVVSYGDDTRPYVKGELRVARP